jgi:hypothetical protein
MLKRLPKNAKHIRNCIRTFWNLKITLAYENDRYQGIEADLFWHSHRLGITAPYHVKALCKNELELLTFANIVDLTTGKLFTRYDWRKFVRQALRRKTGVAPDNLKYSGEPTQYTT